MQSETYEVWDYVKYDYGTNSNHNDIWTALHTGTNLTRNTDYSTIDEGTNTYAEYRTQINNMDSVIELDMRQDQYGGWVIAIFQENTQLTGFGTDITANTWIHMKIVIEGTTMKLYKDGSTNPSITRTNIVRDTSKPLYFGLCTPQNTTLIDFKDFKVYPL